jgi:hypothetical protein
MPQSLTGEINVSGWNDSKGAAQFQFDLSGPHGRAHVETHAARTGSTWTLTGMELHASSR